MGEKKHIEKVEKLFEKSPVVNFSSVSRLANNPGYAKQLLKNLILKGKIKKLTRGYYTIFNDATFAVFCFKPAYLGLHDALSFHGLWEQETIPVLITTRKVRQGVRQVMGTNILIRRIGKKYFFGFDYYQQGEFYFPYSDVEKTFIDMVYFKEKISKDVLENFKEKINMKKLNSYAKRYPGKIHARIRTALGLEHG